MAENVVLVWDPITLDKKMFEEKQVFLTFFNNKNSNKEQPEKENDAKAMDVTSLQIKNLNKETRVQTVGPTLQAGNELNRKVHMCYYFTT